MNDHRDIDVTSVALLSEKTPLPLVDSAIMVDVARLLSGRTRDIRLSGKLRDLFNHRSWHQAAKVVRAWMAWVVLLDALTLFIYAIVLPHGTVASMLLPASMIPPAAVAVLLVFRTQRPAWFQGTVLLIGLVLVLLSISLTGVRAGGEFHERHLNVMLCVAITAIIMFPVPLSWTVAIGTCAIILYLVLQLLNPLLGLVSVLAGALFFASGIIATIVARRTMTILAQKSFLLELRDRTRLNELAEANERLERLLTTDPLTGIANRRLMIDVLDQLWRSDAVRTEGAAMLMCDIDEFKRLNDCLGHAEGDRCLIKVAEIIQSCMTGSRDQVARFGGEEFLIVLPGADEQGALRLAEHIRKRVEAASLPHPASRAAPHVTVSIGVAYQSSGGPPISPDELQHQADEALYTAKRRGRNRVFVYAPVTAVA